MSLAVGRRRAIVGLVIVLGLIAGGAVVAGVVGTPTVSAVDNRFAGVNEETTTVDSELTVENPNFFGVDLGGVTVNYTVTLNEVRFANGTKEGVSLSTGNETLTFRTVVSNQQIPTWWVAHIRDGESSDLVVNARIHSETFGRTVSVTPVTREISTDLLSAFDSEEPRPVNANQPVVSDPILYVNETSAQWGAVSEDETPIQMTFEVYNPKTIPFTITALGYDVTMNEVPVGSGELEKGATIPPKETRTVEAVTVLQNEELDAWWVTHLERNQVTDLRIDFYATVELPGGQTVRVPLDALTYTETMETDIFDNKNETSMEGGSSATPGDPGSSTATDDETTSTSTATESSSTTETSTTTEASSTETATAGTETRTTTETTTETDDGGLLG